MEVANGTIITVALIRGILIIPIWLKSFQALLEEQVPSKSSNFSVGKAITNFTWIACYCYITARSDASMTAVL